MKKSFFMLMALVLFLAGCAGGGNDNSPSADGAGKGEKPSEKKIAMVLPEKIGVNPFFQLMEDGLQKAGQEFNVKVKTIESTDPNAFEQNLRAAIADKYDLIITATFHAEDALNKLAAENPNQAFAILDTVVDQPNVRSAVFREYESSYLLGALVGLITEKNIVGMVAADDIPLIKKWTVPFEQGLKSTNPDAKFLVNYVGGFEDPGRAKELALLQYSQGADFIVGAAAVGDLGVFEAAKEKGFYTSGQDMDHTGKDPEHIIMSQIKGTDTATYETVKDFMNDDFSLGTIVDYGLKENGVGLPFVTHETKTELSPFIGQENIDKVKAINEEIVSGKRTIDNPLQ
ncbi:BMP family protein [Paenibacillus sp. J2TS4]|uniref:BMP family lipoprotein n=1 Tax=Paenibacillus sp. J2TS4 TaxID=2807194 RepID=UPI001B1A9E55|nr:BMP family protein [Paenibacillus sp. J2TS4]GIP35796.1 BMP family ABC transporter substrate-binding protein [Paenibacillus sp. J2TS4]